MTARSCCSLGSEFPHGDLKLGGVLRERAIRTEKRVAPESATRGASQYVHGYDADGRYYDAVRLKITIPGKKAK